MSSSSGQLVHLGSSYFGTDVKYVSVVPAEQEGSGAFLVFVSEATPESRDQSVGVVRSAREFSELHAALRGRILCAALPDLPTRPVALLEGSDGGEALEFAYSRALQAYLAELVAHEDVSGAEELSTFTGRSFKLSAPPPPRTNVLSPPARPASREAPTLVRLGSGKVGAGSPGEGSGKEGGGKATKVTLSWSDESGDHSVELPALHSPSLRPQPSGSLPTRSSTRQVLHPNSGLGNPVIDVRSLNAKTGFFTHDPGFTSTSSCESAISFIDGAKGLLMHRGYPIEQLASSCSFLEVAFLLIEGELPTAPQLRRFEAEVHKNWMVHEKLLSFFGGFKSDAHPMAIMVSVVGALSAFYPDSVNIHDAAQRRLSAIRMVAKMPTIAAIAYKTSIGEPVVYPSNALPFAANFLHMMFATPAEPYKVDPVHAEALEMILLLHADHEQNASTSTVRIASSSQANPFACIAAGIASLWGPAHGGANEAVLRMLGEIGTVERIPAFIAKAKDKADPFRLMGFGHRVYKNFDPRAKLMQKVCHSVFAGLNLEAHPDLQLAQQLEKIALEDEYFVKRSLYPNVDFYSGIVLRALGIPTDMFTVLFAVARTSGWLAQWNESFSDPQQRISRPRQLYSGVARREFVPLAQRGGAEASPRSAEAAPAAAVPSPAFAGAGVVVEPGR